MSKTEKKEHNDGFPLEIYGSYYRTQKKQRWSVGPEKQMFEDPHKRIKTFYDDWRFQIGAIAAGAFSLMMIVIIK